MDPALAQQDGTPAKPVWKLWLLLSLGGPIGFLGALPYFLPLLRQAREHGVLHGAHSMPMAAMVGGQLLQITLLTSFAAWVGAVLSKRTGLDAPYLRAMAEKRPAPHAFLTEVPRALFLGALFSAAILAINFFASPYLPEGLRRHPLPPMGLGEKGGELLRGASSAFYGGIVEELLLRWGMLSALAALLGLLRARGTLKFWIANVLTAALFGAGHLPAVHALGIAIDGPVIAYVVLANGLAGLVCGWLFYRRGLEAAMVAHGFGDICIHALPLAFPQI